jgi:hypothetical protein
VGEKTYAFGLEIIEMTTAANTAAGTSSENKVAI